MTQEEKALLIKDLCGRLPYGVFVECNDNDGSLPNIWRVAYVNIITEDLYLLNTETTATKLISVEDIKPYLFPLSSMAEEQQKEANIFDDMDMDILSANLGRNHRNKTNIPTATYNYIDWLNANQFDYRGLIPMGLALDATGLNIY